MIYPNNKKQMVLDSPLAKGYKLANVHQRELVQLELEPAGVVPTHALPIHVTFYVTGGSGSLTIDNEAFEALKGDVLEVKAHAQRSWHNTGDKPLQLLVIKEVV